MLRPTSLLVLWYACAACSGDSVLLTTSVSQFAISADLRIDGYEADLVPIGGLAVARDGTIIVSQSQDHALRFFGPSGESIATFGGRGAGPGEFESLSALSWLGDTLVIYDGELQRFTLVSPERQVLRTVRPPGTVTTNPRRVPDIPPSAIAIPRRLYSDGTVYAGVLGRSNADEAIWARLSPDGAIESVILRYRARGPTIPASAARAAETGGIRLGMPFESRPRYHLSMDGARAALVQVSQDESEEATLTVTVVSSRGDTVFQRVYGFDPVPIPNEVADSAVDAAVRMWQDRNPALAAAIRTEAQVPPFYPPVEGVVNGRDSTVWIRLRESGGGQPYLILDPAGNLLGSVLLPMSSVVLAADLQTLWAVESDQYDVQSIVRYRIGNR